VLNKNNLIYDLTNAILKQTLISLVTVAFDQNGTFFIFHKAQCTDGIIDTENFDDKFIFPSDSPLAADN